MAAVAGVRAVLVSEQRRAGAAGGVVMEGRDIGTVVFPDAGLKIFLDASVEVRAERRRQEHLRKKASGSSSAKMLEEVRERDRRDRERAVSPLVRAGDAVLVDNTAMDAEETARLIVLLAREREQRAQSAGKREQESRVRLRAGHRGQKFRVGFGFRQPAQKQLHGLHRRQRVQHLAQHPDAVQFVGRHQQLFLSRARSD